MTSSGPAGYHATVSKMARKYSQHTLPHPSTFDADDMNPGNDPIESFNEEKESINMMMSPSSINTVPPMTVIPSVAEMDDDLLSDTQTMISHHSSSRLNHGVTRSSSGGSMNSMRPKQVHFSPIDEIRSIQMDRAFFMGIFDKYFVDNGEEDVDLEEFGKSLHRLGARLSMEQTKGLFEVLVSDDSANGGYLDREQFADFLTRKYEAPQLVAYHNVLLQAILENAKKNDNRRSVMVAAEADQWDAAEVSLQEMEMRQAMEQMVDTEMERIKVKQVQISSVCILSLSVFISTLFLSVDCLSLNRKIAAIF